MRSSKRILSAKEVAEYLRLHRVTVHKYAREGKIPAFKIGIDWKFQKKAIDRWLKEKIASNKERKKPLFSTFSLEQLSADKQGKNKPYLSGILSEGYS